jgi:RNA polymerase sigma-70 factor, ECF subfamily
MQRLASGDETAIRTIYRRFARPVFGVGHRILGSREAAEELTQDVFLTAWRKAARFDPSRGRLSTWLMAIAHNMAVDRLRRVSARTPETLGGIEDIP